LGQGEQDVYEQRDAERVTPRATEKALVTPCGTVVTSTNNHLHFEQEYKYDVNSKTKAKGSNLPKIETMRRILKPHG
jgi:hypothetical protein